MSAESDIVEKVLGKKLPFCHGHRITNVQAMRIDEQIFATAEIDREVFSVEDNIYGAVIYLIQLLPGKEPSYCQGSVGPLTGRIKELTLPLSISTGTTGWDSTGTTEVLVAVVVQDMPDESGRCVMWRRVAVTPGT